MRNKIIQLITVAVFLFLGNSAQAAAYDFYVNASSGEAIEDGSEQYPFKTINSAIGYIEENHLKGKKVFVKKGVYGEAVRLSNNTKIYGESKHETIIDGGLNTYGIYVGASKSLIKNLTVRDADTNLIVAPKAQATIEDCVFKDSRVNGVEVEKGSTKNASKFIFRDSSVTGSGKRGMYIFKRRIEITGSEIKENDEEGIDLHTGIKGKVANNKFEDNGEGGLELAVGGVSLTVSGNTLSNNHNSGIAIQIYSAADGKVKLSRNTIKNNHKWGIRYVDFYGKKGHKFKSFIDSKVNLSKNTISGNKEGDYTYK